MPDLMKIDQVLAPPGGHVPFPPQVTEAMPEQSELLKWYLHILNKRKWLVLASVLTLLSGAAAQTYTTTPMYTSTAQIQIDVESPNVLPYQDIAQVQPYYYETESYSRTQHRILSSKVLASRVVTKLKLAQDKSFNRSTSPGVLRELVPKVTNFVFGLIPNQRRQAPAAPRDEVATLTGDNLAYRLLGGLSVEPDRGSRIVNVSYSSHDPALAQEIVNSLAQEYIELNFETRYKAAMMATEFLNKELEQLKIRVEKSDETLLSYAREHGIVGEASEKENIVLQKLASLNEELTKVQADLITKAVQFEASRTATVPNFPENLKTTSITDIETRLSRSNQELASLLARYGQDWPEVAQKQREIFELDDQLVVQKQKALGKVRSDYELAQNHYRTISTALEDQKQLANKLNQDSIQFNILKREVDSNKQLYEGLLQRLKEASVSAGLRSSNIHIVQPGDYPQGASGPRHARNMFLGLLIGLILGIGFALAIDYFDNTVKTPDEVERYVVLPSLGIIPAIDDLRARKRRLLAPGNGTGEDAKASPYIMPGAAVWEAYRSLRTSILLSHSGNPPRRILVTSALPGEGKTTTAINTAIVLSQTGARTLLVDLDMRKPEIGRKFGVNGHQGMSIFLSGNSDLSSQILETPYANLFIIPAGPQPPNPAELVGSARWHKALLLLGEYFEYVVIDSPPILSVADPVILSTKVDGVVLVVLAAKTAREAVKKAKASLQNVGATILGAMINNVDLQNAPYSYYYRHYYGYGYGYYGEQKSS
jgi:succinoglycan biosynthesis transport protein ExoP